MLRVAHRASTCPAHRLPAILLPCRARLMQVGVRLPLLPSLPTRSLSTESVRISTELRRRRREGTHSRHHETVSQPGHPASSNDATHHGRNWRLQRPNRQGTRDENETRRHTQPILRPTRPRETHEKEKELESNRRNHLSRLLGDNRLTVDAQLHLKFDCTASNRPQRHFRRLKALWSNLPVCKDLDCARERQPVAAHVEQALCGELAKGK